MKQEIRNIKLYLLIHLLVSCIAILTACAPQPTIDGTSKASYDKSLGVISESLSEKDKLALEGAIMSLTLGNVDLFDLEASQERLRKALNGLTAQQVIERHKSIRTQLEAEEEKAHKVRERKQLESQLESLNEEYSRLKEYFNSKAEHSRRLNEEILVSSEKLSKRMIFGHPRYTVSFVVNNKSAVAITTIGFKVVLSSPGRTVPWITEYTGISIRGGVEPGEIKTIAYDNNMFDQNWGKIPSRTDYILQITPTSIYTLDSVEPYYNTMVNADDQERFEALPGMIAEIKSKL